MQPIAKMFNYVSDTRKTLEYADKVVLKTMLLLIILENLGRRKEKV